MVNIPNFSDPQFVDANGVGGLNAAMSAVSGSVAVIGQEFFIRPGLLQPELVTMSFSGMVATVTIPAPAGIVNSSGVVALAHGIQTGLDTQTYTVNFAPLVPATGTVTAYLVGSATQIQQDPFPIPGPPPGHPSYNPNFIPTIGYSQTVDTIALSATTTAPNNTSTFEFGRATLTHGQVTLSSLSTFAQLRASTPLNRQLFAVSSSTVLTVPQLQYLIYATVGGITTTLPPASSSTYSIAIFVNSTASDWTIAANGSDTIFGGLAGGSSGSTIPVHSLGAVILWSNGSNWIILGINPGQSLASVNTWTGTNTYGAGGGWSSSNWGKQLLVTTPAGFSNPAIGITDVNGVNLWGISNGTGALNFARMPAYGDNSTPPNNILTLSAGGAVVKGSAFASSDAAVASGLVRLNQVGTGLQVVGTAIQTVPAGIQAFSSAGTFTFTVPTGVTTLKVSVWGGGGGGGGCVFGTAAAAAGGGGGGYAVKRFTGLAPGSNISVAVGAGGTGGGPSGNGLPGGPSSVLTVSATGGSGGTAGGSGISIGGAGGSGVGGDIGNGNSANGSAGNVNAGTAGTANGGTGGAASSGGGGGGSSVGIGGAGGFPGGGGAGTGNSVTANGASGGNGLVIIEWP